MNQKDSIGTQSAEVLLINGRKLEADGVPVGDVRKMNGGEIEAESNCSHIMVDMNIILSCAEFQSKNPWR